MKCAVYVSEAFKRRVEESGLTGAKFVSLRTPEELAELDRKAPPTRPTETPLTDEQRERIRLLIANVSENAKLADDMPPRVVVAIVGDLLDRYRGGAIRLAAGPEHVEDFGYSLGALWGEQVRRAVGWEWVQLAWPHRRDVALVSPDRAFCVYPFDLLPRLVTQPELNDTTMLTFNTLTATSKVAGRPRDYMPIR